MRLRLEWPYGCKHVVMLAGSWADWKPQVMFPMPDKRNGIEVWSTEVELGVGLHRYKFIVDGTWLIDASRPSLPNQVGSKDNVIKV